MISVASGAGVILAVLVYCVAAYASLRAGRATGSPGWRLLAILLLLLALVRAIRIDFLLLAQVEYMAHVGRWYGERAPIQKAAMIMAGTIALIFAVLTYRYAHSWKERGAMAAGLALVFFTAARAISLHAADALLTAGIGPINVSRLVEFGLLAGIVVAARISWGYSGGAASHRGDGSP